MRKLNLVGRKFGRLLVIEETKPLKNRVAWKCRCDCGKITRAVGARLTFGAVKSCGCFERESRGQSQRTHGEGYRATKEYRAWLKAKGRCYNPRDAKYPFYGGRGIRMSEEWRNDYSAFLRDMGRAPKGTSIDRIDNNGHYCKENCRWATPTQQTRNQSRNVLVQLSDGTTITLAEHFERQGIPYVKGYTAYWRKNKKQG